ncbi:ankyrin repeat and MYND domain-containing protein 1 [Hypomesus transpacificus]|uniref:ankyrin repeat and MYND domain-containing protein 1 n=1 Tax=Hypomesus transpacificus TaxID=137520 RepID=UPI001F07D356|nr:ankyrin repeat and MYND domain-containing protein 1 [Hypomesus transpacificus]
MTTLPSVAPKAVESEPRAGGNERTLSYLGRQDGCAKRNGPGVQKWSDGSKYEGEFLKDLKHGSGTFTWVNGEFYQGTFYKDYRHGKGTYTWPGGHKFVGKFYLNRKEGYGLQVFPDGSTFQGLYRADERFGPGVMTYPDGRQDVGLWHRERLLRLCTSLEGGFTLRDFPEHYMPRSVAKADPWNQDPYHALSSKALAGGLLGCQGPWPGPAGSSTDPLLFPYKELLRDERFILPPDIECYSTDSDHLPIPWGLRRELDHMFFGENCEGPDTDPAAIAALPLQRRMQVHIHKHRFEAEGRDWDVQAVLSENRERFGPKGPLEVRSERLIQEALLGNPQSVYHILRDKKVHPDVGDARGHTALIAATINSHKDVIHLLLDSGADVNKLNSEGMSALAVCHILYYPIQTLHRTVAERDPLRPPLKSQVNKLQSWSQGCPVERRTLPDKTPEPRSKTGTPQDHQDRQAVGRSPDDHNHQDRAEDEHAGQDEDAPGPGKGPESEGSGEIDQSFDSDQYEKDSQDSPDTSVMEETEETEDEEESEAVGHGEEGEERGMRQTGEEEGEEEGGESEENTVQVLDGVMPVGSVSWSEGARSLEVGGSQGASMTEQQTFNSARSVASFPILVSEEVMQQTAEALSRTGLVSSVDMDPRETVHKMALIKAEHRARWATMTLLLDRGADPNASRVPMPVLFLATKAGDIDGVRRLLECGARTDLALPSEQNGLYPLHIAAALPGAEGPRITELLLHAVANPDVRAQDEHEVFHLDKNTVEPLAGFGNKSVISSSLPSYFHSTSREPPAEGGRTALHVACQRDSDYTNAREVVSLLLSHKASSSLLWSGHSPLSLAIASGNDLALDELLAGGADPNLPLTRRVGSALCAMTNIHYDCGAHPRNRTKLLEKLMKAGANIMMPVVVGEGRRLAVGTAVDYAHYTFQQDWRIAHTPYHALNPREREAYNARRQTLSLMGDLLRQAVVRLERQRLDREGVSPTDVFVYPGAGVSVSQFRAGRMEEQSSTDSIQAEDYRLSTRRDSRTQNVRKCLFKYCYQCGRSVGVALAACSRCHEVFYCSKTCKMKAWNERHKEECVRVSGNKRLSLAQKVLETHKDLKENYSFI